MTKKTVTKWSINSPLRYTPIHTETKSQTGNRVTVEERNKQLQSFKPSRHNKNFRQLCSYTLCPQLKTPYTMPTKKLNTCVPYTLPTKELDTRRNPGDSLAVKHAQTNTSQQEMTANAKYSGGTTEHTSNTLSTSFLSLSTSRTNVDDTCIVTEEKRL